MAITSSSYDAQIGTHEQMTIGKYVLRRSGEHGHLVLIGRVRFNVDTRGRMNHVYGMR